MAKDKRVFTGGMDKDSDPRLIKQGDYRHAENIRNIASSDGTSGSVENIESNVRVPYSFKGEESNQYIEVEDKVAIVRSERSIKFSQEILFSFLSNSESFNVNAERAFTIYSYTPEGELKQIGYEWSSNGKLSWAKDYQSYTTTPEFLFDMFNEETGKISINIPIIDINTGNWETAHSKVHFDRNFTLGSGRIAKVEIIADKPGVEFLLDFKSPFNKEFWSSTVNEFPDEGRYGISNASTAFDESVLSSRSSFITGEVSSEFDSLRLDSSANVIEDQVDSIQDEEVNTEILISFDGQEPTTPQDVSDLNLFSYVKNVDGSVEVLPFLSFGSNLFNSGDAFPFSASQNSISKALVQNLSYFESEVLTKGTDSAVSTVLSKAQGNISLGFLSGDKLDGENSNVNYDSANAAATDFEVLNTYYDQSSISTYNDDYKSSGSRFISIENGEISVSGKDIEAGDKIKFPAKIKKGRAYRIEANVSEFTFGSGNTFNFKIGTKSSENITSTDSTFSWQVPSSDIDEDYSNFTLEATSAFGESDSLKIKSLKILELREPNSKLKVNVKSKVDFNLCFGTNEEEVKSRLENGDFLDEYNNFIDGFVDSRLTVVRKNAQNFSYITDQISEAENEIDRLSTELLEANTKITDLQASYNQTIDDLESAAAIDSDQAKADLNALEQTSSQLKDTLDTVFNDVQPLIQGIQDIIDITSDNQAVADAAYAEGAASVTPEDGITQADVDTAVDAAVAAVDITSDNESVISQAIIDALSTTGYTSIDALVQAKGTLQTDADNLVARVSSMVEKLNNAQASFSDATVSESIKSDVETLETLILDITKLKANIEFENVENELSESTYLSSFKTVYDDLEALRANITLINDAVTKSVVVDENTSEPTGDYTLTGLGGLAHLTDSQAYDLFSAELKNIVSTYKQIILDLEEAKNNVTEVVEVETIIEEDGVTQADVDAVQDLLDEANENLATAEAALQTYENNTELLNIIGNGSFDGDSTSGWQLSSKVKIQGEQLEIVEFSDSGNIARYSFASPRDGVIQNGTYYFSFSLKDNTILSTPPILTVKLIGQDSNNDYVETRARKTGYYSSVFNVNTLNETATESLRLDIIGGVNGFVIDDFRLFRLPENSQVSQADLGNSLNYLSQLQFQALSLNQNLNAVASQADLDAAYAEGAASVTPEDGVTQADVDAAVAAANQGFITLDDQDGNPIQYTYKEFIILSLKQVNPNFSGFQGAPYEFYDTSFLAELLKERIQFLIDNKETVEELNLSLADALVEAQRAQADAETAQVGQKIDIFNLMSALYHATENLTEFNDSGLDTALENLTLVSETTQDTIDRFNENHNANILSFQEIIDRLVDKITSLRNIGADFSPLVETYRFTIFGNTGTPLSPLNFIKDLRLLMKNPDIEGYEEWSFDNYVLKIKDGNFNFDNGGYATISLGQYIALNHEDFSNEGNLRYDSSIETEERSQESHSHYRVIPSPVGEESVLKLSIKFSFSDSVKPFGKDLSSLDITPLMATTGTDVNVIERDDPNTLDVIETEEYDVINNGLIIQVSIVKGPSANKWQFNLIDEDQIPEINAAVEENPNFSYDGYYKVLDDEKVQWNIIDEPEVTTEVEVLGDPIIDAYNSVTVSQSLGSLDWTIQNTSDTSGWHFNTSLGVFVGQHIVDPNSVNMDSTLLDSTPVSEGNFITLDPGTDSEGNNFLQPNSVYEFLSPNGDTVQFGKSKSSQLNSDWFVPTTDDLKEIYSRKNTLNDAEGFIPFNNSDYLSSTLVGNSNTLVSLKTGKAVTYFLASGRRAYLRAVSYQNNVPENFRTIGAKYKGGYVYYVSGSTVHIVTGSNLNPSSFPSVDLHLGGNLTVKVHQLSANSPYLLLIHEGKFTPVVGASEISPNTLSYNPRSVNVSSVAQHSSIGAASTNHSELSLDNASLPSEIRQALEEYGFTGFSAIDFVNQLSIPYEDISFASYDLYFDFGDTTAGPASENFALNGYSKGIQVNNRLKQGYSLEEALDSYGLMEEFPTAPIRIQTGPEYNQDDPNSKIRVYPGNNGFKGLFAGIGLRKVVSTTETISEPKSISILGEKIFEGITNEVNNQSPVYGTAMSNAYNGAKKRIIKNINTGVTSVQPLVAGSYVCVGAYEDKPKNRIYYFVSEEKSSRKRDSILEYDLMNNSISTVYQDNVGSSSGDPNAVLTFSERFLITGVNKVDDILYFTDNLNRPRKINVELAKKNEENIKNPKFRFIDTYHKSFDSTVFIGENEDHPFIVGDYIYTQYDVTNEDNSGFNGYAEVLGIVPKLADGVTLNVTKNSRTVTASNSNHGLDSTNVGQFLAIQTDNFPYYYKISSVSGTTITIENEYEQNSQPEAKSLTFNNKSVCGIITDCPWANSTASSTGKVLYANPSDAYSPLISFGDYEEKIKYFDVVKHQPLNRPNTQVKFDSTVATNNILDNLFQFKYRYLHFDEELTSYSGISDIVLDDAFASNSPVNASESSRVKNKIEIYYEDTVDDVTDIEIVGRKGNDGEFFLIDSVKNNFISYLKKLKNNLINKSEYDYSREETSSYLSFYNNGAYPFVDKLDSDKLFDSVPIKAKAQTVLSNNRLAYGNVVEGYDNTKMVVSSTFKTDQETNLSSEEQDITFNETLTGGRNSNTTYYHRGKKDYSTYSPTINFNDITLDPLKSQIVNLSFNFYFKFEARHSATWRFRTGHFFGRYDVTGLTSSEEIVSHIVSEINNGNCEGGANSDREPSSATNKNDISAETTSPGILKIVIRNSVPNGTENIKDVEFVPNHPTIAGSFTSGAVGNSTFKTGAFHNFGIAYFDETNRCSFVNAAPDYGSINRGDQVINLNGSRCYNPFYTESSGGELKSSAISEIKIYNKPPEWAKYYQMYYTGNTTVDEFIQISINDVKRNTTDSGDSQVYLGLGSLKGENYSYNQTNNSQIDYNYVEGDRIRFISCDTGTGRQKFSEYIDLDIAGYEIYNNLDSDPIDAEGFYIRINDPKNTSVKIANGDTVNLSYAGLSSGTDGTGYDKLIVEIYRPKKNIEGEFLVYKEVGDKIPILNGYHSGQSGDFIYNNSLGVELSEQPAVVKLTSGDVYVKPRNMFVTSTETETFFPEDYYLNDFHKTNHYNVGRINVINNNSKARRLEASVYYSETYSSTGSINGLSSFNLATQPYFDYNKDFGSIQALKNINDDLIIFHENKVGRVLVGKSILSEADGNGLVSLSRDIIKNYATLYSGDYGCSLQPESIVKHNNRIYFTDVKRGAVLRLSADGLTTISDFGMKDYFRDIGEMYVSYDPENQDNQVFNIVAGYDPKYDEYIVTFPAVYERSQGSWDSQYPTWIDESNYYSNVKPKKVFYAKTVAFNEDIDRWTSFYSFHPEFYSKVGRQFVGFQAGYLFRHNMTDKFYQGSYVNYGSQTTGYRNYNRLYNKSLHSSIEFPFNSEPSSVKTYNALAIEGDSKLFASMFTNIGQTPQGYGNDYGYSESISTSIGYRKVKGEITGLFNDILEGNSNPNNGEVSKFFEDLKKGDVIKIWGKSFSNSNRYIPYNAIVLDVISNNRIKMNQRFSLSKISHIEVIDYKTKEGIHYANIPSVSALSAGYSYKENYGDGSELEYVGSFSSIKQDAENFNLYVFTGSFLGDSIKKQNKIYPESLVSGGRYALYKEGNDGFNILNVGQADTAYSSLNKKGQVFTARRHFNVSGSDKTQLVKLEYRMYAQDSISGSVTFIGHPISQANNKIEVALSNSGKSYLSKLDNDFSNLKLFIGKDGRVEGERLKGSYMMAKLSTNSGDVLYGSNLSSYKFNLYSASVDVDKSELSGQ